MKMGVWAASAGVVAWAALGSGAASAQLTASVEGDVRYEDNLFRISRAASEVYGLQRSDTIFTAKGDVSDHFVLGAQTLDVDGEIGHEWYRRSGNLDNTNYLASFSLKRPNTGWLGYSLTASANQELTPFNDLGLPVRNLQQVQRIDGEADIAITPDIRIVLTPSGLRSTSGSAIYRSSEYWQAGGGAGIGYFSPIGNSIAVTVSRSYTKGLHDRPTLINGALVNAPIDLTDTSVDFRLEYAPSVITKLSGVISYVRRSDHSIVGSDYKGPEGHLTFTYQPRDSLNISVSGGRRLETQSFVFVEAIRNDFVQVAATVIFPDSTNIVASGEYQHRELGFLPYLALGQEQGSDHTYVAGLKAQRIFLQRLRVTLGVSHEWRTAQDTTFSYHATVAQAGLAFVFGNPVR